MAKTPEKAGSEWVGTRRLLKELRDALQQGGSVAKRLDQVTRLIANEMVAEVCSLYVQRAGEVLELFATRGLKPEAVHFTRLRVGEGLVGQIAATARPWALADAPSHPSFAYRPETGEEIYRSLMGVPILREGRVLGVLVVQNRTQRHYTDEEVEALETVGMVLAEMLASGGVLDPEESKLAESTDLLPIRLTALTLNDGVAMGQAVPHARGIIISKIVAENPLEETARLQRALNELRESLESLFARAELASLSESNEVLETYRLFAADHGWVARIEEAIASGLTAEAGVQKVQNDTRARMAQVTDAYLRERLYDLDDLALRLLQHLTGAALRPEELPDDMILIARNLGPAELLDYDRRKLKGVVLGEGSPTAHVAIIARALGIPMVGRCPEALERIRPGDQLIIDGPNGQLLVRPRENIRQRFQEALADRQARQRLLAATRDLPAISRDGVAVSLLINAGLLVDLSGLKESGAQGVGLYRTEVPFMVRDAFPTLAEQRDLYARVFELAEGRAVTFRTLDIGGDKALPYWSGGVEENPAMGWRAIRIGLDRPYLLRRQLRALIEAAAGRPLNIMFPMIADVAELKSAQALLQREVAEALARGLDVAPPRVGAMLEVPALLWQLPQLLAEVDFLSIGSNDLLQFLFASDRGNPLLARRYDPLSPPVLRLLRDLARAAGEAGVALSLCGDLASHPLEAMALLGCGLRVLSMPPPSVAGVKLMLRSLSVGAVTRLIDELLERPDHSLRGQLQGYAHDRGIVI